MKSHDKVIQEFTIAIVTPFGHNVIMKVQRWQAVHETVQMVFHILLVAFIAVVIADAITRASIVFNYIVLDHALMAVLFFGVLLFILESIEGNFGKSK